MITPGMWTIYAHDEDTRDIVNAFLCAIFNEDLNFARLNAALKTPEDLPDFVEGPAP